MTEIDWLACTDPTTMLTFAGSRLSQRQLRLFAIACCRRIRELLPAEARQAVAVAERIVEGEMALDEGRAAFAEVRIAAEEGVLPATPAVWLAAMFLDGESDVVSAADLTARAVGDVLDRYRSPAERLKESPVQAHMLRDIFGPISAAPMQVERAWLSDDVIGIAQLVYEQQEFERLPILADALQDAGCTNTNLVNHCRQSADHVRGCWAIDLLLARR